MDFQEFINKENRLQTQPYGMKLNFLLHHTIMPLLHYNEIIMPHGSL